MFPIRNFLKGECMSMLTEFQFGEQEIRVVVDETTNEPLWVAKDICEVLQYKEVSKTLSKLDDDEKGTKKIRTLGGEQNMAVINESGLYTLILRSNKPEAKKFKKWVTAEVLPTIRKTGSYSTTSGVDSNAVMLEMLKMQQQLIENSQKQTEAVIELVKSMQQAPQLTQEPQTQYLDSRDRKKLRDAIQEKAKEVANDIGVSVSTITPAIWIQLKSFFDVDDYQDILKSQMKDVMHFVMFWEPEKGRFEREKPTHQITLDENGNSVVIPIV